MRIVEMLAIAAVVVSGASKASDEASPTIPATEKTVATARGEDQAEKVGSPTQTSGKVVSVHSCKLAGVSDPHLLVKIQTEEGDVDIVDLGSAEDLKHNGIEPREGQQLWVSGRVGRINDKELVVAESLSESKLVTIVRTAPLREESEKHAAARNEEKDATANNDGKDVNTKNGDAGMQVKTIDGTVIHSRNFKIEGETEEHVICKLQTESGIVVVDLGATSALPKIDLTEGRLVAVTGYVGQLNSNPIIVADSVGNLSLIQCEEKPISNPAPER